MKRSLRERVRAGEPLFGTFSFLSCPSLVEILAESGFDFVIIDLEHSPKNWDTVQHMVRAGECGGTEVLIRTRDMDEKSILEALELGVSGVVVPMISTAEQSKSIALSSKYGPEGNRGTCTASRSSRFGALRGGFVEHARRLNEETLVVALLEDAEAVENAEEIAAVVPGADVIVVGRADLAASLGCAGQVNDPKVLNATDKIVDAVATHGVEGRTAGIGVYGPKDAEEWIARGVNFFIYATDTIMIRNAAVDILDSFAPVKAKHTPNPETN